MKKILYLFIFFLGFYGQVAEAKTNLQLPRFVTVKAGEANVRTGPGLRYQIKWVLVRENMPVEVVGEFEQWRKIKDVQNDEGWIHRSMLTNKRSAIITGETQVMRKNPDEESQAVARLEVGVNVSLLGCKDEYCRVKVNRHKGWVRRDRLWGVYPDEVVN